MQGLISSVKRGSLADAAGRSGDAANLARIVFHVSASFPDVVFASECVIIITQSVFPGHR